MIEDLDIVIDKNYNVKRLRYWLSFKLSDFLLFLFSWFWHFALYLLIGAAVIFTPFMLKILLSERRYGWIIFFLIIVIAPTSIIILLLKNSSYISVLEFVPLTSYYFYCFLLRIVITDWLDKRVTAS